MRLLVIEHEGGATPFIKELCKGRAHHVVSCRMDEAAEICRHMADEVAWIVLNGIPAGAEEDLVRILRMAGCQAPVVHLSVQTARCGCERNRAPGGAKLTRLDIHRIMTQPGGPLEHGETFFEYHAPHPVKGKDAPVHRKARRTCKI